MSRRALIAWALILVLGLGIAGHNDMQAELAGIEGIGDNGRYKV